MGWSRPNSPTKRMRIKFWRTSRPPLMKRLGEQVCKWEQHKYLVDQITILPSLLQTGANLSFSITSRKFQTVQMVINLGRSIQVKFHMYSGTTRLESFPILTLQIPCRLTGSNLRVLAIRMKSHCHSGQHLTERIGRSLVIDSHLGTRRFLLNILSSTILVDLPLLPVSITSNGCSPDYLVYNLFNETFSFFKKK